jgi:homoserine O-acetyltransferase
VKCWIGLISLALLLGLASAAPAEERYGAREGDYLAKDFRFRSGESLPELRVHYTTLGTPRRDAAGHVTNAILILHGTGGSGGSFFRPFFSDVLFVPGGLLDPAKWYIILPDGVGHGKSSKPSDGLRARFPKYDYDDMAAAQHELVTKGLGVDHLRLIFGTSMGCMHAFVWGETWPEFADALMPMACLPDQIAGRNRIWREMAIDAIKADPAYKGGDYAEQPWAGMRTAAVVTVIAGSAPHQMQKDYPTRAAADKYAAERIETDLKGMDANDAIWRLDASRTYDPSPNLGKISARVLWINSADDFINPPELGIAEREVKRIKRGRFILLPISDKTHGHGTHTWAEAWKGYLEEVLREMRQ